MEIKRISEIESIEPKSEDIVLIATVIDGKTVWKQTTLGDCLKAINYEMQSSHILNKENPHSVTAEQVNAYDKPAVDKLLETHSHENAEYEKTYKVVELDECSKIIEDVSEKASISSDENAYVFTAKGDAVDGEESEESVSAKFEIDVSGTFVIEATTNHVASITIDGNISYIAADDSAPFTFHGNVGSKIVVEVADGSVFFTKFEKEIDAHSGFITPEEKKILSNFGKDMENVTHEVAGYKDVKLTDFDVIIHDYANGATYSENIVSAASATFEIPFSGEVHIECLPDVFSGVSSKLMIDDVEVASFNPEKYVANNLPFPSQEEAKFVYTGKVENSIKISTSFSNVEISEFKVLTSGYISGTDKYELENLKGHTHAHPTAKYEEHSVSLSEFTTKTKTEGNVSFTDTGNGIEISGGGGSFVTKLDQYVVFKVTVNDSHHDAFYVNGVKLTPVETDNFMCSTYEYEGSLTTGISYTFNEGTMLFEKFIAIDKADGFMPGEDMKEVEEWKSFNIRNGSARNSIQQKFDTETWSIKNKRAKEFIENDEITVVEGNKIKLDENGKAIVGAFGENSGMMNGKSQSVGGKGNTEGSKNINLANNGHVEGNENFNAGQHGHVEGSENANIGNAGHTEGRGSVSEGDVSHAQGLWTKAHGDANNPQHVDGRCNEEDHESRYSHITGNGEITGYENGYPVFTPRNSRTLDWNGNVWYRGKVLFGGENMDDPNAKEAISLPQAEALFKNRRLNVETRIVPTSSLIPAKTKDYIFVSKITNGDSVEFGKEYDYSGTQYFGYVGVKNEAVTEDKNYLMVVDLDIETELVAETINVSEFYRPVGGTGADDTSTNYIIGKLKQGKNYILYPFTASNHDIHGIYMDSCVSGTNNVKFTLNDVRLYQMTDLNESKSYVTGGTSILNSGNTIIYTIKDYALIAKDSTTYAVPLVDNLNEFTVYCKKNINDAFSTLQMLSFAKGVTHGIKESDNNLYLAQGGMYYLVGNAIKLYAEDGTEIEDSNGDKIVSFSEALFITSRNKTDGKYYNLVMFPTSSGMTTKIFDVEAEAANYYVRSDTGSIHVWEINI